MNKTFIMFFLITFVSTILITKTYIHKDYERFESYKTVNTEDQKEVNNYNIFIDGTCHKLYVFNNDKLEKEFNIASGKKSTPTPNGVWKIVKKAYWGEGFGGYWLGLNVPWGIYGIHGTTKPSSIGKDASHGCIRMHSSDAKELYNIIPCGTAIYIYMGPYGPFTQGYRSLKPGDFGSDVLNIQMVLRKKGYYTGALDGKYGNEMQLSLHKFQKDNNLYVSNLIKNDMYNKLGLFSFE